jgi:uncharacterized membrane protein
MTNTTLAPPEAGRGSAFAVYLLYLLSIPSFAVFALVGVIVAVAARDGAGPLARAHLDDQIRYWFLAFWWAVGIAVISLLGWILTIVLIGFPIIWVAGLLSLILFIWFTVKSFFGLLKLIDGRPPT